jgi:hypothetical protein
VRVLPWHSALPTDVAAHLTRLIRHLGGDDALLRRLDEHPGRARVVAHQLDRAVHDDRSLHRRPRHPVRRSNLGLAPAVLDRHRERRAQPGRPAPQRPAR